MRYDIVITGGGIVGLTLACALAQRTSLTIAVIEAKQSMPEWDIAYYQARVSAITLTSQHIFQQLSIWDKIQAHRVSPFTDIDVWDATGKGQIHFSSQDIAQSQLGYIIENNLIQQILLQKIKQYATISYIAPAALESVKFLDEGVELKTATGETYHASLAVAADGANSWLRPRADIAVDKIYYEQSAIITNVVTSLPHHRVARQVFLNTGPLAFLPLAEPNLSSIVWSLPTEEATTLLSVDEEIFKQELTQAFGSRLGNIEKIEKRFAFPLFKQQAKQYIKPHLALVGDAAHTVHPLAGQGVNMGLLDAMNLADVIVTALHSKRSYTSYATLRRYERSRKAENMVMANTIDGLKKLFASNSRMIQHCLITGLNITNKLPLLKNFFMKQAM